MNLDDNLIENPDGLDFVPIMGDIDIDAISGDIEYANGDWDAVETDEWDRSQFARDGAYEVEAIDDEIDNAEDTNFLLYGGLILIALMIIAVIIAQTRKK